MYGNLHMINYCRSTSNKLCAIHSHGPCLSTQSFPRKRRWRKCLESWKLKTLVVPENRWDFLIWESPWAHPSTSINQLMGDFPDGLHMLGVNPCQPRAIARHRLTSLYTSPGLAETCGVQRHKSGECDATGLRRSGWKWNIRKERWLFGLHSFGKVAKCPQKRSWMVLASWTSWCENCGTRSKWPTPILICGKR